MPLRSKDQIIRPYGGQDTASCLTVFDSNVRHDFAAEERPEFLSFLDTPHPDFFVICDHHGVVACGGCYVKDAIGRLCWGMVHSL